MEAIKARPLFAPGAEGLLSPLLPFFQDKLVSEILINKPQEVFVERQGAMGRFDTPLLDATHLRRLFTFIANENRGTISEECPLLSGSLYDGTRVQLVVPPAARFHALAIRRPSTHQMTLQDYRESNFYNQARAFYMDELQDIEESLEERMLLALHRASDWAGFIELAVHMKKNIVVSGQTSSGKTTYLNACIGHLPLHERIITLEDTFEVNAPHKNVVNLRAPKKRQGEVGGLCMQDLVQCALRLRPDRLIMGEIRGAEVLDFVSACATGHEGSITSIHAGSPRMALMRMVQLYKLNNVPSMQDVDIRRELDEVIDVIVQVSNAPNGRMASSIYYKRAMRCVS